MSSAYVEGAKVSSSFCFDSFCTATWVKLVHNCLSEIGFERCELTAAFASKVRSLPFAEPGVSNAMVVNSDAREFTTLLDDPNVSVRAIAYWGLLQAPGSACVLAVNSSSLEASRKCPHSISIVSEGWFFDTPGEEERMLRAGLREYNLTKIICEKLDPLFSSICIEDTLPNIVDLHRQKPTRVLRDFYVSARSDLHSWAVDTFSEAYVEPLVGGSYISCREWFNPKRRSIAPRDATSLSASLAKKL